MSDHDPVPGEDWRGLVLVPHLNERARRHPLREKCYFTPGEEYPVLRKETSAYVVFDNLGRERAVAPGVPCLHLVSEPDRYGFHAVVGYFTVQESATPSLPLGTRVYGTAVTDVEMKWRIEIPPGEWIVCLIPKKK
jgi:hypothetical protein